MPEVKSQDTLSPGINTRRQSLTFLWRTMTFFDTMVTQLRRVNGRKYRKKKVRLPRDQNVKI